MNTSLFLILLPEPSVSSIFNKLHQIFGGKNDIHITLRGPYTDQISSVQIEKIDQRLREETILIGDVGIFQNAEETIVYFKAICKNLQRVLIKPDFPDPIPHISLYRGNDQPFAKAICDFLKSENIRFPIEEFKIEEYHAKQIKMFPRKDITKGNLEDNNFLFAQGRIKPGLIQRANNMVSEWRKPAKGASTKLTDYPAKINNQN